ncbi:methyltransferase domain-containing protein [Cyanobacteria bacterium FACHB-63]|nr:methyltransferase domain-containing protein [Cyanobacteria bacterium FACHB-63]
MHATKWITSQHQSLLDVGCNLGEFLQLCKETFPHLKLAGVEINKPALVTAQQRLSDANLHHAGAESLPFASESFDYVTCTEVLEHIPVELRSQGLQEMQRVLKPNGYLVLSTPHRGWFDWMDAGNLRFRMPGVYRWIVKGGLRDSSYEALNRHVEWHGHFKFEELMAIAGEGWKVITVERGGLFLFPLMDLLSWFFYRKNLRSHPIRLFFERIAGWDDSINYGQASYRIMIVLQKVGREIKSDAVASTYSTRITSTPLI